MFAKNIVVAASLLLTVSCGGDSGGGDAPQASESTRGIAFYQLPQTRTEQFDGVGSAPPVEAVTRLAEDLNGLYERSMGVIHQKMTPHYNSIRDGVATSANPAVQAFDQNMHDSLNQNCSPVFDSGGVIRQYESSCDAVYIYRIQNQYVQVALRLYSDQEKRTTFTTPPGSGRRYTQWTISSGANGLSVGTEWVPEGSNSVQQRDCVVSAVQDRDVRRCIALIATANAIMATLSR